MLMSSARLCSRSQAYGPVQQYLHAVAGLTDCQRGGHAAENLGMPPQLTMHPEDLAWVAKPGRPEPLPASC